MAFAFDEYFPFDPGAPGAATANATRWRKMGQLWAPDGVRANFLNSLNATQAGNQVTVQSGAVFIHGYYAESQNPHSFTVGSNGTIVAQASLVTSNELVNLVYRDGITDYGSTPAANFQQDPDPGANIWEIPIWGISGGTLVDLRTMVSGGQGVTWAAHFDIPQTLPSGTTTPLTVAQFLVARVSYVGWAKVEGTAMITFQDLSQAQNASCQLSYQQGIAGQAQLVPATPVQPGTSAWGSAMAGQTMTMPITLSGLIPVTLGRKTAGWLVSAGPGPAIQISNMTMSMRLVSTGPAA